MTQQTMAPYQGQAQPAQQPQHQEAAAVQIPPPGAVQSGELDDARWKAMRAKMCTQVAALAHTLGFNLVADETLLKMGFPLEDQSRYENGEMDMDFEESSIEWIGDIELTAGEIIKVAQRFRWNLMIRNHDTIQPEETAEGTQAPQ